MFAIWCHFLMGYYYPIDHSIIIPRHEHRKELIVLSLSQSGKISIVLDEDSRATVVSLCHGI